MIKKSHFISYMVDVHGYSETEAVELWNDHGGEPREALSDSEFSELCLFNGFTKLYA